jgi:hypothetical protein
VVYRLAGQKIQFWGEHSILWESVLWSLLCEEIYYFVYPILRYVRWRVGSIFLIPPAMALSVALAASQPKAVSFHELGPIKTALILYPVWLLGCVLAEQVERIPAIEDRSRITFWRLFAWFACWAVLMLHFHSAIHYVQTCMFFGVVAYFWVKNEIAQGKCAAPPMGRFLELFPILDACARICSLQALKSPVLGLPARLDRYDGLRLRVSYVFYLLVEGPSHQLARRTTVTVKRGVVQRLAEADPNAEVGPSGEAMEPTT